MGNAIYADGWSNDSSAERHRGTRRFELPDGDAEVVALDSTNANSPYIMQPLVEQHMVSQLRWTNLPGTAREVRDVAMVFSAPGSESSNVVAANPNLSCFSRSEDVFSSCSVFFQR